VRRSGLSEERVAELYAEGMTLAEIAATGGVSPTFVQDSLKRAGIARRPQLRRVRRCPKCEQEKAVLTNGYCRSCHNAYVRDRGKDGEPPAPPMSYSELEALYRLTATEKMLVLRCSHAYGSSPTPEDVLDRAGIPWRRQVALLSCTVAHARERTERRESA
jgi:hypothetical protein